MPAPSDSWEPLGCSCYRCCCCPAAAYYPPQLGVTWHNYVLPPDDDLTGTVAPFTIKCVWKDCPRGSHRGCAGDETKCCDAGDVEVAEVDRCHDCTYQLLDADGHPGLKPVYHPEGPFYAPPAGAPKWAVGRDEFGNVITAYLLSFSLDCTCGDTVGIPTYYNPDFGVYCGWTGFATYAIGYDDLGYLIGIPPEIVTVPLNQSIYTDGNFPDPPWTIIGPLDPFLATCCPLRAKFLLQPYVPAYWCDDPRNSYWADPAEWPPTGGGGVPWNFPIPYCFDSTDADGCGYPSTGTACDCSGAASWGPNVCQANPNPDFSFIDVTGGVSCSVPESSEDNCLNARQPDGAANAC
jgi:hypothetical protein